MNTFLVSGNYAQCARILDPQRLNRQLSECCTIAKLLVAYELISNNGKLPFGVIFPPVIKLWLDSNHDPLYLELREYYNTMNDEWRRHHNGKDHGTFNSFYWRSGPSNKTPRKLDWPIMVYQSHRSKLLSKDYSYYFRNFTREGLEIPPVMSYVWTFPDVI